MVAPGARSEHPRRNGEGIVVETDGTGAVQARFAQGPAIDEPLAQLRGGATHFYNADGLGSITSLTDSTGAVAATCTYDSFGNAVSTAGTVANPFRYTAREWDPETGLYFYRAPARCAACATGSAAPRRAPKTFSTATRRAFVPRPLFLRASLVRTWSSTRSTVSNSLIDSMSVLNKRRGQFSTSIMRLQRRAETIRTKEVDTHCPSSYLRERRSVCVNWKGNTNGVEPNAKPMNTSAQCSRRLLNHRGAAARRRGCLAPR